MISTLFYPSKPNNIFCHPNYFDSTCVDTIRQGFYTRDQLWIQSDNDLYEAWTYAFPQKEMMV